jgi:hypothetical protein
MAFSICCSSGYCVPCAVASSRLVKTHYADQTDGPAQKKNDLRRSQAQLSPTDASTCAQRIDRGKPSGKIDNFENSLECGITI